MYEYTTIQVQVAEDEISSYVASPDEAVKLVDAEFARLRLSPEQEHFLVICRDNAGKCFGARAVATGGTDQAAVDTKIVFRTALGMGASSIIVAHNHPSGKQEFSDSDRELTKKLVAAGSILDIPCLDHILVAGEERISLHEQSPSLF